MKILVETPVEMGFLDVKKGFDESLFKQLSPPFPSVKVVRFDGCKKGDTVALELNFLFFKQKWTSLITEDQTSDLEFAFVDEGTVLPFFLKKWKHRHRVISTGIGSIIRDEISYEGPFSLLTWALYPVLLLQFSFRKPIYRKVFSRAESN